MKRKSESVNWRRADTTMTKRRIKYDQWSHKTQNTMQKTTD